MNKKRLIIAGAALVVLIIVGVMVGMLLKVRAEIARVKAVALTEHDISKLPDDELLGTEIFMGTEFQVAVRVAGGRIVQARVMKDDGRAYVKKARVILDAVVAAQAVKGIDAVSGATVSSKVLLNATQNALEGAAAEKSAPAADAP